MSEPTPYERLLAEELPTGRFGGPYRPAPRPRLPQHLEPTTPEDAARHAADLDTAAAAFDTGRHARRHLEPVPDPEKAA